jgi:choline dehydrogenase
VIQDLPVGYNLQDHNALGCLTFVVNASVSIKLDKIINNPDTLNAFARYHKGMVTVPGGTEALAFIDLKDPMNKDGYPDLELLFIGATLAAEPTLQKNFGITDEVYKAVFQNNQEEGYMIFPMILRPKSRGRVFLQSRNPLQKPIVDMGYFTDPADLDILVKGVEWSIKLSKTKANRKFGSKLVTNKIPGCDHLTFNTPAYWKCYAKHITLTIYHQSGTCKMGPDTDPTAVVDPRLRVKGIKGLRVIDASIIPVIPAAHTNFPVIMIAEKGSDMIKMDNL